MVPDTFPFIYQQFTYLQLPCGKTTKGIGQPKHVLKTSIQHAEYQATMNKFKYFNTDFSFQVGNKRNYLLICTTYSVGLVA